MTDIWVENETFHMFILRKRWTCDWLCDATNTDNNFITCFYFRETFQFTEVFNFSVVYFTQKLFISGSKQLTVRINQRSITRRLQVSEDQTSTMNLNHRPLINKAKDPSICLGTVTVSPDRVILALKKMEIHERVPVDLLPLLSGWSVEEIFGFLWLNISCCFLLTALCALPQRHVYKNKEKRWTQAESCRYTNIRL